MTTIPRTVPPLPIRNRFARDLPIASALVWLRAGWQDIKAAPGPSLLYGLVVCAVSLAVVAGLYLAGLDFILFPALAGFMILGPLLAVGLYEKSRRLAEGGRVSFLGTLLVVPRSGGQLLFTGVLLSLLMALWMRAAVLLYALFFGLRPFPGLDHILGVLLTTPSGWALIVVGSLVGGLFAAFAFAISVFSIPMLLAERRDALTAMGTSLALVWHNLPVMLAWGAIVMALTVAGLATGMLGLIVVFPLLGHATWHAYQSVRAEESER